MSTILLGLVCLIVGLFLLRMWKVRAGRADSTPPWRDLLWGVYAAIALVLGMALLGSSSFVYIPADQVGHLRRVYFADDLPPVHIVALAGKKGPQAQILGPGFHFNPFMKVIYDVELFPIVDVPEGSYGQLTAKDGKAMPEGMFIAPAFSDSSDPNMLDATTFLSKGGFRGPQETVLTPGAYRLNRYLFDVRVDADTKATVIPAGHVGVVKSNVQQPDRNCVEERVRVSQAQHDNEALSVPLVPKGCIGLWKEALLPGAYYLNRHAYDVTLVDTRVQTWEYKGGFVRRMVDLSIDQQGNLKQSERTNNEGVPQSAVDKAILVKVEGWDIQQDVRVLVQVSPENAPIVVGSVGGIDEIEHRILTPAIRSIIRNVAGSTLRVAVKEGDKVIGYVERPTRVLDLIEHREEIEDAIEKVIKAGVEIREIRLGDPAIPPELLVARMRLQLADQLGAAYARETEAQKKRIETEQARATADEQPRLVQSQIAVQVAVQREAERSALGRAERKYLEELAYGQRAQAEVLGQDRVALLQGLEKILGSLEREPQLVALVGKLVPNTVVTSGATGAGLEGAAAVLGGVLGAPPKSPQQ
jgi:hypothetical protein